MRRQHLWLILPVLLVFLGSCAVTVLLLFQAAKAQNAVVVASSERAAATFLVVRERIFQRVLMDRTGWTGDEAVQNLLVKYDPAWAEANLGRLLKEAYDVGTAFVIGGDGKIIFAAENGVATDGFDVDRFGPGFASLVRRARAAATAHELPPISPLALDGKSIELVAASALVSSAVASPDKNAVLVIARRLDSPTITTMAEGYGLKHLQLLAPGQAMTAPAILTLADLDGRTVGALSWKPLFPSERILRRTVPEVVGTDLVIVLLMSFFLIRARRLFVRISADAQHIAAQNAELAKRELHLRAIQETVTDGLVTIDPDGTILAANLAVERIFGRPATELRGVALETLWQRPANGLHALVPAADDVGANYEAVGQRADGTPFTADVAISGVSRTEPRFRVAVVRDITQRKRIETVLNLLSVDMIMLDGDGKVLMANGSARERLAAGDGLAAADGLVRTAIGDQRPLAGAIRAAAEGETPNGTILNLLRSGGRWPLSVLVAPLAVDAPAQNRAPVVLFVSDPERRLNVSTEALIALYALTPAEARVVSQLVKGKDLQEIAADSNVSVNTLRNQLKHVFRKTGTSRQPELISLVLSNTSLIANAGKG